MNPYKEVEDNTLTNPQHLSYEDIATKLLKDNYFLTALELHTELVESGKELPELREFFSNPGNFEQHVFKATEYTSMHRSPSQATLDSLDTARYSEDGGGDRGGGGGSGGDVAVLEFELRKARDTINALRANLTQVADSESALDKNSKDKFTQRSLKTHEKRALNFLINEYLLLHNYKLTSITFSDENPDQEFEDWDDVGLNMPRPAGLASLFWGTATLHVPKVDGSTEMDWERTEVACQMGDVNVCVSCQTMEQDGDWSHELLIQAEEIELLKQKIVALETEKLNFQKLYDAAIVSLNSLTSPGSEKGLNMQLSDDKLAQLKESADHIDKKNGTSREDLTVNQVDLFERPITCTATENHYGSGNTTHSATPEQFEIIDSDKHSSIVRKEDSNPSSLDPAILNDTSQSHDSIRRGSATTLDDTASIDAGEWTRVPYEYTMDTCCKEMWIDSSGLPNTLKMSILNWCCDGTGFNEPLTNDLLAELINNDKPVTLPEFLTLVADTMPRIIPHTLVARRCEAAALLAASAALLPPGDVRRARTLQALLTLVKRPSKADSRAICEATSLVVKWGASGEVLSSIAELLSSKSAERRILASQICVSIAPYVPIELCTSLLLSLVLLMCESSETEIRNLGLKAVCLICPVAEHKYAQLEGLMVNFLKDPVEKIVKDTVNVFVPILARTALIAGKFSSDLCKRIISNLLKCTTEEDWKNVILYLEILKQLVLAKLAYIINVQIVRDAINCDINEQTGLEIPLQEVQEHFLDLQCYVTDGNDAKLMLVAMDGLLKQNPDVRWKELSWFITLCKQILEVAINSKLINHSTIYESVISLFSSYVDNFTIHFTLNILRPIFVNFIVDLEQKMEKLHTVNVDSTVVVGVYLVAILPVLDDETKQGEFLQKWLMYSSIRGLPVKIFSIPLKWVAAHKPESLNFYLQHLREFSASSCESPSGVSIRTYIANLLTELVNSAALTEHSVETQLLPAVVALLHDDHSSVREVAITAWGSVTRLCVTRGFDCEPHCWVPMDHLLGSGPLSGKEAARAAEAVSLLVLPTADNRVSDKAVSMLCSLCLGGLSPASCVEWVLALTPGLQLASHHCRHHPALLTALRKLEETVQTPSLSQYKPAIDALLHNVSGAGAPAHATSMETRDHRGPNLQAAHEVGRRVTQMFQQKTNMNLQNIFKKKT